MGSVQPNNTRPVREPIAIVGSSCRLPGSATSPSKLWELLKNPRDISEEVPSSRFDANVFYHQDSQHHGSTNTRNGYLLQDEPRLFDRDFFNISPKEAEAMDPQQRNLLEIVYEGVESAGYSIPQLQGSATGVFVGVIGSDFQYASMRGYDSLPQYFTTGGSQAILANRISYFFDWRGSSSVIDAACSSSLVALHQAVLALRSGEIDMAAVAGSNLILGPELYMAYSNLNMLSPSGRSRMWDSSADGYGRGEGFTSVIVKTLSQAIADGDHIECIIRETGVNQDGRTPGITMPGAESQAQLIRDTYMRCGLDPVRDRPQFFEAHGTGTPAGDPIEAQAIHDVFFPGKPSQHDGQLLVGSIKTVVGHTEGCSGIAGLLKASLAVQHGQIPPNLHFRELNPKIEPFYERLRVPTALTPWPALPNGEPRRASVNSFGFGGTNAHVVIESWNRAPDRLTAQPHPGGLFVLSANSAQALTAKAAALAGYLRENPETNLVRLGRTLFRRGDFFLFRAAFSAISAAQLIEKLEARIEVLKKTVRIPAIPKSLPPRILGVFTGQGAQWATMGKELYETSSVFRKAINRLQQSLDTLPDTDRPDWKLIDELSASKGTSRVGIASISQPICTALQIALVDTLRAAGVNFAAVVGHSSGEIAAAYTAGYLDARDAIRVAYYRGFHAKLAQGSDGKRGKMMAVGLGFEAASNFCSEFGLKVAASNSSTSCTLAGDAVLIDEAKERLDQDKIFARALAVDTAYHSHHMLPCAEPYLESLRKCGVKAQAVRGPRNCQWYSSVWGPNGRSRSFDSEEGLRLLDGQYWVDNLTNTVQFSQAVSRALSEESSVLDLALEVGPHPALKGPSSEAIKSLTGLNLPYGGVLQRGQSAVEAFADCLGLLWTAFPSPRPLITFSGLLQALPLDNPKEPGILKDLPTYPWDHDSLNWRESRANRLFRNGPAPHELLGRPNVLGDKGRREVHWRQVFKLSELPWVRGHTIQGEVIFPGTGYVAMAYEAAVRLVDDQQALQLFELHDIEIVRAMSMQEDSPGLEVVFTVRVTSETDSCITADVACYSGDITMTKLDGPVNVLNHTFSGGVRLFLGPAQEALSTRKEPLLPMTSLDMGQLYTSLSKVGYNYSDHFVARAVDRHLGRAVVSVSAPPESSAIRACVHPVVLDTAIQGHLSALAYPEDGRLGTTYLATGIDCVRINMAAPSPDVLKADSVLLSSDAKALKGDVDLFNVNDGTVQIQMLGVQWTALNQPKERWLYAGEVWARNAADGIEPSLKTKFSPEDEVLRKLLVRTAHFYLRRLRGQIKPSELILMNKHRRHMMKWVREHLFPQIEAGKLPDFEPGWANDTLEDVQQWSAPYLAAGNNDMLILHATGNNLLAIARGTMPPLQVLLKDGMLDRLYVEGVGFADGNLDLEILVKQLAHRYPRMKVLEVGAGTGGTTRAALSAMRDQYASYMYTDISAGFFENAKTKFSEHASKMSFKILNIEKDLVDQGFDEGAYDMVIASNALHATRSMKDTLGHCRRLLRPDGFLVLLEITTNHLPIQLIMGTLPGWWLGIDEGRVWQPTLSLDEWDRVLQEVGFSGVDTSSTPSFCSVIMSQATNETFQTLREPLSTASSLSSRPLGHVLVVGDIVSELASKSQALLASYESVHQCDLAGLEAVNCPPGAVVLSLCDLESPVFEQMTEAKFEAIRTIFSNASAVLWVTTGAATGKSPMANITVGLGRILLAERSDLRLQFLDVDDTTSLEPSLLADLLLKLTAISQPDPSDILWTHEPHLELRDGAIYIPRVLPLDSINRHSAETAVKLTEQDTADQITTDDAGPAEQKGTFASDKTYILFGMTGDVGISIARWMVENGARNVVLTSRHPDVPAGVFEFMSQKGAVLRAVAVDVTDKEGLRKAFSEIKSSMPPIIGGIINGAMVLRDRPFADTPWEDFEAVLAPKVAGTRNLDELFGASEEALDFFIVLSSATSFVGISGQSSYSAANHYMSSLVRSRRARGLAGSVVVIGFLTGLGYIYRSDPKHLATIEKSLLPRLDRQGETDLHDMLLKAIECGRPDSAQPSELVTGIRRTFAEPWHNDPRLSGYLVPEGAQDEGGDGQDEAEGNIKVDVQLAAVEGEDPKEGLAILIKCFSKVLGNVLQLDPTEISSDVPVAEHGVDSLVSVRIREWFLKDLGVDVPVLKLMSTNHTLSRLCEDALASWRKLRPGYRGATGSESQAQPAANKDPDFDWKKEVDGMLDGIAALAPPQTSADADADADGENNNADPPRTSARRVVLTGCTGFLGTHMLRALVADNDVAEVHCLCLRSRPLRVQDPKKIRQYKGDLGKPQLGLSAQAFKRLSQTADLIIHVGADVAHLKSYQQMRAANVVSTQHLLAMATPRSVPVHFISSSAVAMLQKDTSELAEVLPSSFGPPADAESLMKNAIGYAASKWMGEILVERAARVPGVVHRFPNIVGPDAPEEIPLIALDNFCTRMRAVPALDPKQWVGELDIIDVRDVVPEFLARACAHDSREPVAVHNYCSENRYLLSDLVSMYKARLGGRIDVLPTKEWMNRAIALGMPKGVEATFTGTEVFVSPVLRKGRTL